MPVNHPNTSVNQPQPHRFVSNYDLSDADALWDQDDDPDEEEEEDKQNPLSSEYCPCPEGNVSMLARTAFRRALVMNEISRTRALQEAVNASNGNNGGSLPVPLVAQGLLSSPMSQPSSTHSLSPPAEFAVMNTTRRPDPTGRQMYWTPQEFSMTGGGSNNMSASSDATVPPLDPMSLLSTSARRQLMAQQPLSSHEEHRPRSNTRTTTTRGIDRSNMARVPSSNPNVYIPARPLRRSLRTAARAAAAAAVAQSSPEVDRKMPAKRSPNVASKSCKLTSVGTTKSKCEPLKKNGPSESTQASEPDKNCCICLEKPTPSELSKLSGCSHNFCFSCIEKWAERENTCPLCKTRFTKIERVHKVKTGKRKRGGGKENSSCNVKRVKNRDQSSDSRLNPFQHIFGTSKR